MESRNLALIGFMGTGKTTVGRLCAELLEFDFRDSDAEIERTAGQSVAEIFAREGEAAFRERERAVLAELAKASGLVIATGGGSLLDARNVAALQQHSRIVLLCAHPSAILERVGGAHSRPLLAQSPNPVVRIAELLLERSETYARAAHHHVETTHRTPQEIAEEIARLFRSDAEEKPF